VGGGKRREMMGGEGGGGGGGGVGKGVRVGMGMGSGMHEDGKVWNGE